MKGGIDLVLWCGSVGLMSLMFVMEAGKFRGRIRPRIIFICFDTCCARILAVCFLGTDEDSD